MIIQNGGTCNKCKQYIYSAHVHDFSTCKCGSISVDGGTFYLRRVGDYSNFIDESLFMSKKAVDAIKEAVVWGKETGRNELGIALAVVRALHQHGYLSDKAQRDEK
jgi:hypothetical protein